MATNTAASFTNHTGNASAGPFSISFSYLSEDEIDVTVGGVLKTKTTHYTFPSATTISFTSGNHPGNGVAIKFQRDTDVSAKKVDFQDGSVLTETDLDNNSDQILFGLQENLDVLNNDVLKRDGSQTVTGNLVFEGATDDGNETTLAITDPTGDRTLTVPDITGTIVTTGDTGTVTSAMINNGTIVAGDLASNSVTTAKITDANVTTAKVADDAITSAKIADNAITSAHIADGTVVAADIGANAVTASELADDAVDTAAIANSAVTNAKLGADAVNGSKIADDSIDSEHYVDGSIDTAHIADSQITTAKLASNAVTTAKITDANITTAKLADDAVTAAKIADGAITSAHIAADTVVAADIAANAVTASELADNAVDTAAIAADAVTGAKIADDAVDSEHLAADSIDAEHYAPGSVDATALASNAVTTAKINADAVDGTKIADDAINSEHYTDGSIDTAHIADAQITTAKIADDAVTAAKVGTFNLADLTNVHTATPSDGQVLKWVNSNSRWEPAVDAGASGATLGDGDYGEVTVSSSGSVFTIDNDVITGAKIADDAVGAEHIEVLDANLQFGDSVKAQFGAGNDLSIWHNATDNIIEGTQHLIVKTTESAKKIYLQSDTGVDISDVGVNEYQAKFINDGAVELYFDNSKKFETDANGVTITGQCAVTSHVAWPDHSSGYVGKAVFGNGDDLQIYHDGTNNIFYSDAPDLYIKTTSSETCARFGRNGGVDLYYDNALQCKTASYGLDFADNKRADFGDGNDLIIYHDGSHSIIEESGTGGLKLVTNSSLQVRNADKDTGEYLINADVDGSTSLYYDGVYRAATTSSGFRVNGDFWVDNQTNVGKDIFFDESADTLIFYDSVKAAFGSSNDLQIYHDSGGDSYIQEKGPGDLYITATKTILQNNDTSENLAKFIENGAVELYYDNTKQFSTHANGPYTEANVGFRCGSSGPVGSELFTVQRNTGQVAYFDHSGGDDHTVIQCRHRGAYSTTYRTQMSFIDGAGDEVGTIKSHGTSTQYNTTSDYRLKENEVLISDGITRLKTLKPYRFNFKKTPGNTVDGFFAHEVTAVPEAIAGEKDGTKSQGLDQSKLVPLLTAALQEAITKIETLETKVAALESA